MGFIQEDWIMNMEDAKIVTDEDAMDLVRELPTETLLSVKQVALSIHRSEDYVRALCDSGDLKIFGGREGASRQYILIYRKSVVKYIQKKTI